MVSPVYLVEEKHLWQYINRIKSTFHLYMFMNNIIMKTALVLKDNCYVDIIGLAKYAWRNNNLFKLVSDNQWFYTNCHEYGRLTGWIRICFRASQLYSNKTFNRGLSNAYPIWLINAAWFSPTGVISWLNKIRTVTVLRARPPPPPPKKKRDFAVRMFRITHF